MSDDPVDEVFVVKVAVFAAKDLLAKDKLTGSSDPYCLVSVNDGDKRRTPTIKHSLNPRWNWDANFIVEQGEARIDVEVFDEDLGTDDDFLGSVRLEVDCVDAYKHHQRTSTTDDEEPSRKWYKISYRSNKVSSFAWQAFYSHQDFTQPGVGMRDAGELCMGVSVRRRARSLVPRAALLAIGDAERDELRRFFPAQAAAGDAAAQLLEVVRCSARARGEKRRVIAGRLFVMQEALAFVPQLATADGADDEARRLVADNKYWLPLADVAACRKSTAGRAMPALSLRMTDGERLHLTSFRSEAARDSAHESVAALRALLLGRLRASQRASQHTTPVSTAADAVRPLSAVAEVTPAAVLSSSSSSESGSGADVVAAGDAASDDPAVRTPERRLSDVPAQQASPAIVERERRTRQQLVEFGGRRRLPADQGEDDEDAALTFRNLDSGEVLRLSDVDSYLDPSSGTIAAAAPPPPSEPAGASQSRWRRLLWPSGN